MNLPPVPRRDFFACKMAVLRQVTALPSSTPALKAILLWPGWAIDYALASLVRDGLLKNQRGYWRIVHPPAAHSSVRV